MKKLSLLLAVFLLASMSTMAFAEEQTPPPAMVVQNIEEDTTDAPVLKDVQAVNEGGQQRMVKTWEVAPGYDPDQLAEPDFQKNGYTFRKSYLLMVSENYDKQQKLASQTTTVSHEQKNGVVALLAPLMDYEQDGFRGQLTLDMDSIYTEPTNKSSYSYAVTDSREYNGLARNDTYSIPKTVEKNGTILQLADVRWTELGEDNYRALASYSGTATGVNVSGYTSTATYLGEVTKDTLQSITYAVVYEGSPTPLPPPDYLPHLLVGAGLFVLAVGFMLLWVKRRNGRIYALVDGQYRVVQRIKVPLQCGRLATTGQSPSTILFRTAAASWAASPARR